MIPADYPETPVQGQPFAIPDVVGLLRAIIPDEHAAGLNHRAQALCDAIDLLTGASWWRPLCSAPRDGQWLLVAFTHPKGAYPPIVSKARWVVPEDKQHQPIGRDKRALLERYGGFWTSSRSERPQTLLARAWMPLPIFALDLASVADHSGQGEAA